MTKTTSLQVDTTPSQLALLANMTTVSSLKGMAPAPVPALVWTIRTVCIPVWVVIIVFGCLGNALTIRVLRAKKLRSSSTSLYLSALALVDLLYLLCSLSTTLVHYIKFFPADPRQMYMAYCYLSPVLHYSLTYLSVWLLVAVTIDRMIWVVLPFKAKKICTRNKAAATIAGVALGFTLIDCHFFWTMRFEVGDNYTVCRPIQAATVYFPYIDLVLMGILPFIVMIVANSLIIYKLRKMKTLREISLGRKADKTSTLTTMLLSINIFFMVSISPLLVYDIVYYACNIKEIVENDEDTLGGIAFGVERLIYTLWYLNFSIHFLLYCLSGPKFREEALKLFGIRMTSASATTMAATEAVKKNGTGVENTRLHLHHRNGNAEGSCEYNLLTPGDSMAIEEVKTVCRTSEKASVEPVPLESAL